MNYSVLAYVLVTIILGLSIVTSFFRTERYMTAILSLVLLILIFVFFGLRWFHSTPKLGEITQWPPVINTCPDYLIYFKKGTQDTCIDRLGVSTTNSLQTWTDEELNAPTSVQQPNKFFPYVYKKGMTAQQLQNLCQQAMVYGLTWEGITNGDSCTFTSP